MQGWTPSTVTHELTAVVATPDESGVALPVVVHYDADDPYAVSATFVTGHGEGVTWIFGRDLLRVGLDRPSGEGDVRIWSSQMDGLELVVIALLSTDGEALLQIAVDEIAEFLYATYALCPVGEEDAHLDMDRTLELLLAS
jgi:sporulation and cell division protein SsgA